MARVLDEHSPRSPRIDLNFPLTTTSPPPSGGHDLGVSQMAEERSPPPGPAVSIGDFQQLIRTMYFAKDQARGIDGTFMWLMEEVGELAAALREGSQADKLEEFADVLAWLTTIANVAGVDLTEAVTRKYGAGCPGCAQFACICADAEKP